MKPTKIYLIKNKSNVGISKGSNQAVDFITSKLKPTIIMKIDPDAEFETDGWLSTMIGLWKCNHRIAMSTYISGLRDNPGGAARIGQGMLKGELLGMTKHLGGICVFVDADAYKEFRWDSSDLLHGVQDLEFSRYLLAHQYQLAYLENYFLSTNTAQQEIDYPEYFARRKTEKVTRYEEEKS